MTAPPIEPARALVMTLHAAARAVRLYPAENVTVQKAVGELRASIGRVIAHDNACTLRRVGDYLFVNDVRLRLTLDNYAVVLQLQTLLRHAGIGGLAMSADIMPLASSTPPAGSGKSGESGAFNGQSARQLESEWIGLLSLLQSPMPDAVEERFGLLRAQCQRQAYRCAEVLAPEDDYEALGTEIDARERARQTYLRSLNVTREVMTAARLGRSPGLTRVKRAVQGIVDAILTDPSSLMGLTTLREFDDYTFVHSVNVSILSVAIGRRIGFTRVQMLDLGLAALLHDIGKSRLPETVLNKRGQLSDSERALLRTHSWQGVLALFNMPLAGGRPWGPAIAAFEHHRKIDGSGYPDVKRPRPQSLFSKIIAVADGYDAATTTRVYQTSPWSPADVLRGMRENTRLGLEPVIVKALINLTGIFPVGTLVVLDRFELALVHAAGTEAGAFSRPIVRLLSDEQGNRSPHQPLVDLTARSESGQYLRTIIRTEDPERHGIVVGDYFA